MTSKALAILAFVAGNCVALAQTNQPVDGGAIDCNERLGVFPFAAAALNQRLDAWAHRSPRFLTAIAVV